MLYYQIDAIIQIIGFISRASLAAIGYHFIYIFPPLVRMPAEAIVAETPSDCRCHAQSGAYRRRRISASTPGSEPPNVSLVAMPDHLLFYHIVTPASFFSAALTLTLPTDWFLHH